MITSRIPLLPFLKWIWWLLSNMLRKVLVDIWAQTSRQIWIYSWSDERILSSAPTNCSTWSIQATASRTGKIYKAKTRILWHPLSKCRILSISIHWRRYQNSEDSTPSWWISPLSCRLFCGNWTVHHIVWSSIPVYRCPILAYSLAQPWWPNKKR